MPTVREEKIVASLTNDFLWPEKDFVDWLRTEGMTTQSAKTTRTKVEFVIRSSAEPTSVALTRAISYTRHQSGYRNAWSQWVRYNKERGITISQPGGHLVKHGDYSISEDALAQIEALLSLGVTEARLAEATWGSVGEYEDYLDRIKLWAKPKDPTDPLIPAVPESSTPMGLSRLKLILGVHKRNSDQH